MSVPLSHLSLPCLVRGSACVSLCSDSRGMTPAAGMMPTAWTGVAQMPAAAAAGQQQFNGQTQGVMGYPVQQGAHSATGVRYTTPFSSEALAQPAQLAAATSTKPTVENPFLKFSKSAATLGVPVQARPTLAGARMTPYPVRNGSGDPTVSPKLKQIN